MNATADPLDLSRVSVVIPAFNEEKSIGLVIGDLPLDEILECLVVDNGSTDETAMQARRAGARVVTEPRRGYGSACLAGLAELDSNTEVVVFVDGDYSDYPEEITELVEPILGPAGRAEFVVGSRVNPKCETGALLPQARFGNWLATTLIRLLYGFRYTDLGPFRAITKSGLNRLGMTDRNFGWTVEMQIRALEEGLSTVEVPVSYRRRVGRSKITGTVRGTVKAGYKILWTIFRYGVLTRIGRRNRTQRPVGNAGGSLGAGG